MLRTALLAICLSVAVRAVAAEPSPTAPRLAAISDAGGRDLAALLTAELSSSPATTLLERDQLAQIGDEAKVQQMAGSDATALGRLLGADGVVFLDQRADGLHARLTAVNLGYALFDDPVPAAADPQLEAKALAHLIENDAPKLQLDPTHATPISVLNLRADYATGDYARIERSLTLLLESRLAAVPQYVVLERRHGAALGLERSLAPAPGPLLQGAYIIDGTLDFPPAGAGQGDLSVHLRVRPPTRAESVVEVKGSTHDLNSMVEAIAAAIQKITGTAPSPAPWQPQNEAREYLGEGIWAWEHGQQQAAVEALDSAELLGETAPDLLPVRIQALCQLCVPDLNPTEVEFIGQPGAMATVFRHANPTHYFTPLQPLSDRLALARRAMADLDAYEAASRLPSSHLQFLDPKWQHVIQLGYCRRFVIHAASTVLAELDRQGHPEAEAFREEVRRLAHFDPLNGKLPDDEGDGAFFADDWAHSLDEETAYYRQVLSATGTASQFKAVFLKDRFIEERGTVFCPRFIADPAEQRKALLQFEQSLEQTPEGKLSGLVILSGDEDSSTSEAAYPAFLDELGDQRVALVQSNELLAHCLAAYQISDLTRAKFAAHAVPVLRCFLTQSSQWDIRTLQVLWIPSGFSAADAPAIWSEFKAYKARIMDPNNKTSSHQNEPMFGALESDFSKAFPNLVEAPTNALSVTRFWQPGLTDEAHRFFALDKCKSDGGTAVALGFYERMSTESKMYELHLPDLAAEPVGPPPGCAVWAFSVTPDYIYVLSPNSDAQIFRYNRTQRSWESRTNDALTGSFEMYPVRDQIFVDLNQKTGEGGIGRLNWDSNELTIMASGRRRPAENQFDDRRGYHAGDIFPYIGNTIGVNVDFQCYELNEKPGNWNQLIPDFAGQLALALGHDRTVLLNYKSGIAILVDPAKTAPEILLAPANQALPPALAVFGEPRCRVDPTTFRADFASQGNVGMHGNAFFVMVRHQTVPLYYELVWLDTAHGYAITHIPLRFDVDPSIQAQVKSLKGFPRESNAVGQPELDPFPVQMATTDAGVCLYHPSAGLWFIPYTDIDTYLKTVQK